MFNSVSMIEANKQYKKIKRKITKSTKLVRLLLEYEAVCGTEHLDPPYTVKPRRLSGMQTAGFNPLIKTLLSNIARAQNVKNHIHI